MSAWQDPRDPLVALREGDPKPYEDFVRASARALIRFFRQRGAGLDRAEDLAQEVYLKLYQSAERYRPAERFPAYCFRVARNVWIDDCRRTGRQERACRILEQSPRERSAARVDPLARLCNAEEGERLRGLLARLPATQRAVFELAVLGELSYGEIGSRLSIPVGTVKSRMFYAVRRLRGAWDGLVAEPQEEGVA